MALTLQTVHDRCVEEGDCWIWKQCVNADGIPSARDGSYSIPVRRRVWELSHGASVGRGWFVVSACGNKLCVCPAHALRLNGKQYMARLNKLGKVNASAAHQAARTAAVRRRESTKLDESKAAEVKARIEAGENRGEVARAFGITRSHANRVARGDQWQPPVSANSVFNLARSA